ncbi:MAG: 50S ribosomal protein L13 [Parcubacteria group bacterium GW2011_GWB1_48_6]|nr:MAG: 50S ribosomal protein L13 [Parcubacteria group bacterium GW2011_GWB1_48_6]HXK35558.1 50S ribosomal protein L13 [Candidatus Paceibacterota bacterium]
MQHEIDATNKSFGRLASAVAVLLRGKDQPTFQARIMPTARITVTNLKKLKFTGKKMEQKVNYHYSGYPGGMKERPLETEWVKFPQRVFRRAVYGMLPKNKQRDQIIKHLSFK